MSEQAVETARPSDRLPQPGRLTFVATCFAIGIALAWRIGQPAVWPWLTAAAAALAFGFVVRRRRVSAVAALCIAAACAGAAWLNLQHYHIAADDIASFASPQPKPVRLNGIATRDPEIRRHHGGSMSAFDYRQPATYIPMDVTGVVDRDGDVLPADGSVYVRIDETVPPFRAGDRLEIFGMLRSPSLPRNPGEFNYARYTRSLGQAGLVTVPRRDLVRIDRASHDGLRQRVLRWRESLRQRASQWLLSDLPGASAEQSALLTALLLGQRDPELDEITESFRRVGLAYLLAISGLHLAVVAGAFVLLGRLAGMSERWRGVLLIVVALGYLFLIEVRMPVLRAAVMLIAAGAALSVGRQVRLSGAIALAAVALLIWRPDQVIDAGFQLSFGVVLGLAIFAPRLRQRWFGRPEKNPVSIGQMIAEWLRTSFAVAVVAWIIATPIIAWHFGMLCPLAAPLSVFAIPLVAVLLVVGYIKMLLAVVLPSASLIAAVPVAIAAQVLLAVVGVIDEAPGSTLNVPFPSQTWVLGALLWGGAWICTGLWDPGRGRPRWPMIAGLAMLIVWLYWPRLPLPADHTMRLDVLAVGDGSCAVLRSGGETIVLDAGGQNLQLGDRVIVPALRRMNISHVDAVVVGHANLDHYSAVIEVVDAFGTREILLTPQFEQSVAQDFTSSAAALWRMLAERNVALRTVTAGYERRAGDATLRWLHPPGEATYEHVNDTSMVVPIECAGRSMLMTGDIQEQAIDELLHGYPDLTVDVVEIPHHGSFSDASARLIERLQPSVAFQSCGWSRYNRDRWSDELTGIDRLITARDGMCTITVDDDGAMAVRRFLADE